MSSGFESETNLVSMTVVRPSSVRSCSSSTLNPAFFSAAAIAPAPSLAAGTWPRRLYRSFPITRAFRLGRAAGCANSASAVRPRTNSLTSCGCRLAQTRHEGLRVIRVHFSVPDGMAWHGVEDCPPRASALLSYFPVDRDLVHGSAAAVSNHYLVLLRVDGDSGSGRSDLQRAQLIKGKGFAARYSGTRARARKYVLSSRVEPEHL